MESRINARARRLKGTEMLRAKPLRKPEGMQTRAKSGDVTDSTPSPKVCVTGMRNHQRASEMYRWTRSPGRQAYPEQTTRRPRFDMT